jgi:hypothetical protein
MTEPVSLYDPWRCCGVLMYMARSERDEDGVPIHFRRCHTCGLSIETEERVLQRGSFALRASSALRRNRRYEQHTQRTCSVCEGSYSRIQGGYAVHISKPAHQRALAHRRAQNRWKQIESQRRYRARHKESVA